MHVNAFRYVRDVWCHCSPPLIFVGGGRLNDYNGSEQGSLSEDGNPRSVHRYLVKCVPDAVGNSLHLGWRYYLCARPLDVIRCGGSQDRRLPSGAPNIQYLEVSSDSFSSFDAK